MKSKMKCTRSMDDMPSASFGRFSGADMNPFGKSVNSTDVLIGVGAGLLAAGGVRWILNKYAPNAIPAAAKQLTPLLSGAASAALLQFGASKTKALQGRAKGLAVGALASGLALQTQELLKSNPMFSDLVQVKYSGFNDVLIDNPRVHGYGDVLIDQPRTPFVAQYADAPQLGGLVQVAMGDDDNDGVHEEMSMLAGMR